MNQKFNLGSFEVKVSAGESNPEINLAVKDITVEVTDLSLTEYATVLKTMIFEVGSQIKEFGKMQEEASSKDFERRQQDEEKEFEREIQRHEMRMKEIEARRIRPSFFTVSDGRDTDGDNKEDVQAELKRELATV
jgi:hypothetical protein